MADGVVLPVGGAAPPPPMPDLASLQQMVGAAPGPTPGDAVAQDMSDRLKPVYQMVGDLVNYLLDNPDVAPAARSIIQTSFGATRGMKSARQRAEGGPEMGPVGPPGGPPMGGPPGGGIPMPPLPPGLIPGLPIPPTMGR